MVILELLEMLDSIIDRGVSLALKGRVEECSRLGYRSQALTLRLPSGCTVRTWTVYHLQFSKDPTEIF